MDNDFSRMNGNGMPGDLGGKEGGAFTPRMIDGAYRSNNGNIMGSGTTTVFDTTQMGIGSFNKDRGVKTTQARPFDKM